MSSRLLPRDQEMKVIKATVQLGLKPFGPNKVFHMASLSAHLHNHFGVTLTPEQLVSYFESLFDLRFFEALASRPRPALPPQQHNQHLRPTARGSTTPLARKMDDSMVHDGDGEEGVVEEDEEDMVESGQEDMTMLRPPPLKKRPPSRPITPRPSLRPGRSSINYKE